jgi:hypothetical protein
VTKNRINIKFGHGTHYISILVLGLPVLVVSLELGNNPHLLVGPLRRRFSNWGAQNAACSGTRVKGIIKRFPGMFAINIFDNTVDGSFRCERMDELFSGFKQFCARSAFTCDNKAAFIINYNRAVAYDGV